MFRFCAAISLLLISSLSFASDHKLVQAVSDQRLLNAQKDPDNWITHGRDYAEQRFSPLSQISTDTVSGLDLAWFYDFDDKRGLQATPLVIDGIMYVTASWSVVVALDAQTGELLWKYDPQVPKEQSYRFCCGAVNRGVAAWGDSVFVGTLDGRLIAIDRATGLQRWSVQTTPEGENYSITGAPRVVKGKVIIGNAGSEYGVRGYVSAYDALSGEQVWRFYTVPGNPELGFENPQMAMAAETWKGEWWTFGGGGTVWDSLAYDPELDLLYVGVGNGAPHSKHIRSPGGGDNLFLCSILALRPDTGEYVWHYQEVPGETWDYTATQHMILADLPWQGKQRKLLLHAPKSGFFYVLDRETGELLSAEKFGTRVNWASHYELDSGRPVLTPGADYPSEPFMVYPIGVGSHNWHPMSFSPQTGLVYIPGQHMGGELSTEANFKMEKNVWNTGVETSLPLHNQQLNRTLGKAFVNGFLLAWNPLTQQKAWQIPRPFIGNGGVLSTAGQLVFQGTVDGFFTAHDAESGAEVFRYATGNGIVGSPISYAVSNTQFVSVPVARGGGISLISGTELNPSTANGRMLAFTLNGKAVLPKPSAAAVYAGKPPPMPAVDDELLQQGLELYHRYCNRCHGSGVVSDGSIPDLRYLDPVWHDNFEEVVLNGMMISAGMPRFDQVLDSDGVRAIQAYVLDQAHQAYDLTEANSLWLAVKQAFYDRLAWLLLKMDELAQ
ncbi:MAG: PQQ-dependent dehydrogenase, methanol/ethanol family [Pseudomonadales bacterium]